MSRNASKSPRTTLTDYEARRVDEIAAWKAEFPNPFGELLRRATQPLARAAEVVIPDRVAFHAIEAVYKAADRAATRRDILAQAGVADLAALRHGPLEVCDRLAARVGRFARGVATVEGALTGAGGIWTTLLDVPLLFGLCLRTILKIGHCYGYALDRRADRAWVLGVFAVAISTTKHRRDQLAARLHEIEDLLLEETQEHVIVEEFVSLATQIEIFESIPAFAAATGALLNQSVVARTEMTARHLFRERWLRDHGKIGVVAARPRADLAPAPDHHGWSGALARAGYATVRGLSFGVALPVYFAAAALRAGRGAPRPRDRRLAPA